MKAEILEGLSREPKSIPPKYFYDEEGSRLFTEITRQPEYYPTRTELGLLQQHAGEINQLLGDECLLLEFGSGSSEKIQTLLEGLRPKVYAPLDISRDFLEGSAEFIAGKYPWLEVRAACLDYTHDIKLPFTLDARPVGFFPGSSIGNFDPTAAGEFLAMVRQLLGPSGALLIGVDMKKDTAVLNSAYNDAAGVTEAFNLNVLNHLNEVFGGTFELEHFRHRASYNVDQGCIQMFLEATCAHEVELAGETLPFSEGELVHTENSYKYARDEFLEMAAVAGYPRHDVWQDNHGWFSVFILYGE